MVIATGTSSASNQGVVARAANLLFFILFMSFCLSFPGGHNLESSLLFTAKVGCTFPSPLGTCNPAQPGSCEPFVLVTAYKQKTPLYSLRVSSAVPHRGLDEHDHGQFPAWRPGNYLQTIRQRMNLCRFLDPRHLPFERQQRCVGLLVDESTVLNAPGAGWSLLSNLLEHDDLLD